MNLNIYWIWLVELSDIGPVAHRELLDRFETPEHIYMSSVEDLMCCKGIGVTKAQYIVASKDLTMAKEIYKNCQQLGVNIICVSNDLYPSIWKDIKNIPVLFYYIGILKNINSKNFISFNRKQVYDRKEREELIEIAKKILENQDVYIGTLNEGADNLIHSYLANHKVYTLLLMANGPEICNPKRFKALYQSVLIGGAVLSVYPPKTKLKRFSLLKRSKVLGLMSQGIVNSDVYTIAVSISTL